MVYQTYSGVFGTPIQALLRHETLTRCIWPAFAVVSGGTGSFWLQKFRLR